jgi:hypothetical protein
VLRLYFGVEFLGNLFGRLCVVFEKFDFLRISRPGHVGQVLLMGSGPCRSSVFGV